MQGDWHNSSVCPAIACCIASISNALSRSSLRLCIMLQGSHSLLAKPHSSGEDCLSLHVSYSGRSSMQAM